MKTTKTNGKVGFELHSSVESYLEQLLGGRDWKHDGLIQAVESWYNDRKTVSDETKHGSVKDKPKQGKIAGREVITRETEFVRNEVGMFCAWHDRIEGASKKLGKDGAMITVTSLPESCTFEPWLRKFAAQAPEAKPKAKKASAPVVAPEPAPVAS